MANMDVNSDDLDRIKKKTMKSALKGDKLAELEGLFLADILEEVERLKGIMKQEDEGDE